MPLSQGASSVVKHTSSVVQEDFNIRDVSRDAAIAKASHGSEEKIDANEITISRTATNGHPPKNTAVPVWRLTIIVLCLCFSLLLSSLETSIVATALVNIASNFGDYTNANWVVVSYLLTCTGFMIIYARFSDVFGRKGALLVAVGFFGIFSLACGLARSMKQLIVLRAFQGIGASGIYAMVFVCAAELVPLKYLGILSGLIGAVYVSSSILGPILGGAIVHSSSWRWIFLLNVPCTALISIFIALFHPSHKTRTTLVQSIWQIDWIGIILSLAGTILLVFSLQPAGAATGWRSRTIITSLAVAGLCWVIFVVWQCTLARSPSFTTLPIFPSHLARKRVVVASYGNAFLTGFPFMTALILLPQRYQVVNGLDPLPAGIRMLPLLCFSAVGSGLGAITSSKHNVSFYLLLLGGTLQLLGMGLMSSLSTSMAIEPQQYGFQMILGMGFGLGLSGLIVVARMEVGAEHSAILLASLTQIRVLAGCIALAIASTLLTSHSTSTLQCILTPAQIAAILQSAASIADLPQEEMLATRAVFGDAYRLVWQVMTGVSGAGWVVTWGAWKRARDVKGLAEMKREQEGREGGGSGESSGVKGGGDAGASQA